MYPLIDLRSAIIAETACRDEIFAFRDRAAGKIGPDGPLSLKRPEVGLPMEHA